MIALDPATRDAIASQCARRILELQLVPSTDRDVRGLIGQAIDRAFELAKPMPTVLVTANILASALGLTAAAASSRLWNLHRTGLLQRVASGAYAVEPGSEPRMRVKFPELCDVFGVAP